MKAFYHILGINLMNFKNFLSELPAASRHAMRR